MVFIKQTYNGMVFCCQNIKVENIKKKLYKAFRENTHIHAPLSGLWDFLFKNGNVLYEFWFIDIFNIVPLTCQLSIN